MGFPLGYSELLLPKLLLQLVFLLGFIRRVISWAFDFAGLGDLLESDGPWPDSSSILQTHHQHNHNHNHNHHFRSVSAMLIQELLPVIRFHHLQDSISDSCAVCLYELEAEDEVRRLSNCRHVFHRCCLDRWVEHDQLTCPLCRTPLIPDGMQDSFHDRIWAAAGLPDSSSADFDNLSFYSPTLTYGHPLIS